jgi:hypothetical protein
MEKHNKIAWETEHNTAGSQMIHTFDNGVQVITDFRFKTITTCKDGNPVDKTSLSHYCEIEDYMNFLSNIARQSTSIAS